jgi:hypothetical protein
MSLVDLVTRAIAFGLDAAVINAFAIVVAAGVALTFSVVSIPRGAARGGRGRRRHGLTDVVRFG